MLRLLSIAAVAMIVNGRQSQRMNTPSFFPSSGATSTTTKLRSYPPTSNVWQRVPVNPVLNATEPWEGIAHGNPCVCENVAGYNGTHYVMFYRGGKEGRY